MERTYNTKSCICGGIRIKLAFKADGKFKFIQLSDNDKNCCKDSFLRPLGDITTLALRLIKTEEEYKAVLKALRGQNCLEVPPNSEHLLSCSDCVAKFIEKELPYSCLSTS